MIEYDTDDLVLCHLLDVHSGGDDPGQPDPEADAAYGRSVPGIATALGLDGESLAERIELLSAISTLHRGERSWKPSGQSGDSRATGTGTA